MAYKKKKSINWRELIAQAVMDLIIGIILLIINRIS